MAEITTVQMAKRKNGANARGPSGAIAPSTMDAQQSQVGRVLSGRAVTPTPIIAQLMDSMANGKLVVSMMLMARTTPVSPMSTAWNRARELIAQVTNVNPISTKP